MFKIIQSNEPFAIETINILIYGEPGSGKTSLANTARNPLTLDFDKGAHRSAYRKDVLVVESWKAINDNMAELIKIFGRYDTIVIDTIDTLLDYMGAWIVEEEPKLARNKLQFYGKLRDEFTAFVGKLKTLAKDVIMVAHVKERDEGDFRIKRPAITGGSYDRVLQVADFIGYLYIKDNKRIIDFNPTDYWIGKNSAKFPALEIPDFSDRHDYFSSLIQQMKNSLNIQTQEQNEAVRLVRELNEKIVAMTTVSEINSFLNYFSTELFGLKNGIKRQIWNKVQQRAKELNLEFNKEEKRFRSVSGREEPEHVEPAETSEFEISFE